MPVETITCWMGRVNMRDTWAYLHPSADEQLEWLSDSIRNGEMVGPTASIYWALPPTEREEFLRGQIQAVHYTPMGWCAHNFAIEAL